MLDGPDPQQALDEFQAMLDQLDTQIDKLTTAGDPDGKVPNLIHYRYRIAHSFEGAKVAFEQGQQGG